MTVAQLGFAIDSSQAEQAAADLDKLTSSASKAEQAAQRTGAAGTRMSRGFADLNQTLEKIVGALGRLEGVTTSIDKRLEVLAQSAMRTAKANNVLDQSAVEASTAYKQLEASLNAVTAAQRKGDAELAKSLGSIEKQREAIARLNAELQKLRSQPAVPGGNRPSPANNNDAGRRQILGYQAFDVGQGLAAGTPLSIIAAQQGPQVAQLYAGAGGAKALLGDVASMATGVVSAIGAVPLALGVAGTAAVLYAKRNEVSLASADDALEKHRANIEALGTAYGVAEQKAQAYSAADRAVANAATQGSLEKLSQLQVASARDLRLQFGSMQTPGKGGQAFFNLFGDYKPFKEAFDDLDRGIRSGRIEGEKFIDTISKIGEQNPKYEVFADKILKVAQQFLQINTEVSKTQALLTQIAGLPPLDPLGAFNPQREMDERAARTPSQFQQRQARKEAYRLQTFARSGAEREAAARAVAAAQFDPKENPTDRQNRIEMAGYEARLAAERQLQDAQRDRALNLERILSDQQSEIDLIGKTGGAAVALRKEYELTSQLRQEAARQGIEVDQKELDLIKEKAAALGQLSDLYNQRRFNFDMNRATGDARLSERDRQIMTTLRQYGLPEDLSGANASRIGQQYDWQQAKDAAKGFGSAFTNELLSGSHNIGKAFLKGFESALMSSASKMWEKFFDSIGNIIADWVTGTKSSGSGVAGTVASAVAGAAANDNKTFAAPVGAVTRAPLGDIASYISDAAAKRGIDPNIALRVARSEGGLDSWNLQSNYYKNGIREQSYGPFQLYKGGGLGNAFMSKTGLDPALAQNGPAGVDFALDHAAKNGWGAWYGAGKAGIGNWDGIGKASETASQALDKLAGNAGSATQGLGQLGTGLAQAGQSFASGFGGGFNWSSLFSPSFTPNTNIGAYLGYNANGTDYWRGGLSVVGERGPELLNLPQGSQVMSNHKLMSALASNQNGGGNGIADVRVFVDDNGNWDAKVDRIAKGRAESTSKQSLGGYKQSQQRGGYGDDQKRYASRKG